MPAPQPAPQTAPPQAPSRRPSRRSGQEPEAYDPYSFESYGAPEHDRAQGREQDWAEPPAPAPRAPRPQPGRRRQDQGYDEPAHAGYEQGYDQAYEDPYDQGYDYDEAYGHGYDDRYDDAYDRSAEGDRREGGGAFFEASGAAIVVHLTLVILAIWLTWAYGTSVI